MFFRKKTATAVDTAPPANPQSTTMLSVDASNDAEESIDALADVLRAYGEMCPEVDDEGNARTEADFAKWARHVLVGAPLDADPTKGVSPAQPIARDFRGLVRFFRRHRKQERERLRGSLLGLRDALWTFLDVVSKAAQSDGRIDAAMHERLSRLRASIDAGDHASLRAEAAGTVASLDALLEERSLAQKARLTELAERVRSLGRELEQAKLDGQVDALTRLYNRACFDQFAERMASLALFGNTASLLMIDIDHFKKVNDTFGHPVGDIVLKSVADTLLRAFPRRDDLVARYGGEEFVVVLRNTKLADAQKLATRVVQSMRTIDVKAGEKSVRPTVSVGVAELAPGETATDWLSRADAALYRAKNTGRDRAAW